MRAINRRITSIRSDLASQAVIVVWDNGDDLDLLNQEMFNQWEKDVPYWLAKTIQGGVYCANCGYDYAGTLDASNVYDRCPNCGH